MGLPRSPERNHVRDLPARVQPLGREGITLRSTAEKSFAQETGHRRETADRRNGIGCARPGDKNFRDPDYSPGLMKREIDRPTLRRFMETLTPASSPSASSRRVLAATARKQREVDADAALVAALDDEPDEEETAGDDAQEEEA